jgi:hypothetical protein
LLLVLLLLFGSAKAGLSQDDTDENNVTQQLWLDFNPTWRLARQWDLNAKIGSKSIYPQAWYKVYSSAEVAYSVPKLVLKKLKYDEKVYAGVEFYYIYNTDSENVVEISPYQGYTLKWPNRKYIVIKHKAELGERFQWGVDGDDYSFGLKLSYQGSLTWKFHGDVWRYGKGFYVTCSAKFWWNLIENNVNNDVARITPGIGYEINPRWRTEFLVGWNYTKDLTSDKFDTNSIIYRLRVYYIIPDRKKSNTSEG